MVDLNIEAKDPPLALGHDLVTYWWLVENKGIYRGYKS